MSPERAIFAAPLAAAALAWLAAPAAAQSFDLSWHTMDGGGGISSGGGFTLHGTIGQPDAGPAGGPMAGAGFELTGGFWAASAPDAPCYADCDESGSLDFFDFLCFQNAFAARDPYADCDGSGSHDFFDFLCFQNAFAAGCL
jgi:hypothetical protein